VVRLQFPAAAKVQEVAVGVVGNLVSWPTVPDSPELISTLNDELGLVLQGDKTPEQALAEFQAMADANRDGQITPDERRQMHRRMISDRRPG
jgi:ABC-type glycerol-3-phosphate transport system substrate-binding protein